MRASYKRAVQWIANEDGDAYQAALNDDMDDLMQLISVVFVADLWGKPADKVARDVRRYVRKVSQ